MIDDLNEDHRKSATRTAVELASEVAPRKRQSTPEIDFLLEAKFPGILHLVGSIRASAVNVRPAYRPSLHTLERLGHAAAYKKELLDKSPTELAALCEQARQEKVQKHQARMDDKAGFADEPPARADFSHWGKAAFWTHEEAVALSFGKNPRVVNWQSLSSRALLSTFAAQYRDRLELVVRALSGQTARPIAYIDWATKIGIHFPAKLQEIVEACRDASLEAAPASAELTPDSRQKRKAGRRNLYDWKWIEGMARHVHDNLQRSGGYDSKPGATQAMLIKAIQKAIETKGFPAPSRSRLQEKLLDWKL